MSHRQHSNLTLVPSRYPQEDCRTYLEPLLLQPDSFRLLQHRRAALRQSTEGRHPRPPRVEAGQVLQAECGFWGLI